MSSNPKIGLERHAQTVLTGLAAALIAWVGVGVSTQGKDLAVLSERVISLQSQMAILQNFASEPRFTKDDYYVLNRPLEQDITGIKAFLEKRADYLERLERRVTDLENQNARKKR